ncbi:MAG TPA: hypothetical protein VM452_08930, partial [Caulifigura sp.]|nr:hypothetical protein [Caulifigura sp.]
EQRELWTLPEHTVATLISPRFLVCPRSLPPSHPIEFDVVDLETGKLDDRFRLNSIRNLSPDGRRAVATSPQLQVIDLETANVAWGSEEMRHVYYNARFSASGEELIVDSVTREGTILTARIDAGTGKVIEPGTGLQPEYFNIQQPNVTDDRRYAVFDYARPPTYLQKAERAIKLQLVAWLMWGDRPVDRRSQSEMLVLDMPSQTLLGTMNRRSSQVSLSPASNAFAVREISGPGPELVEIYALPPRANWRWLFQYAVLPPVVLLGLSRVLKRRRVEPPPRPAVT